MTAPTPQSRVTLREIDEDTLDDILALQPASEQRQFVADNAKSIAQAHFSPYAWFRAIYADDTPVGFIMLWDQRDKPIYFLWRLMIDHRHQGCGFGRSAMELLIEHVRTLPNATELLTSVLQAPGGPQKFYEKLGFALTGEFEDTEAVMRLPL